MPLLHHGSGGVYLYRRSGAGWRRAQTLTDPSPAGRFFGSDLGLSGRSVIVAAPSNQGKWPGAAFIYTQAGGRWRQAATLADPGRPPSGSFAQFVLLSGATAMVAGPGADYVFERSASGKWPVRARLTETGAGAGAGNAFPWADAISGGTAVYVALSGRTALVSADGQAYILKVR